MNYLAYGSNLHPERLRRRVPSARCRGAVVLEGWSLHFHKRSDDGSGKCTIREDLSVNLVHAAVFRIDPGEKEALDRFESAGTGYSVEFLELPGFGEVFTYIASPDHIDTGLKPYRWYRDLVLAGCAFHRFPESYRRMISSVGSWVDPDRERHERHMAIIGGG